MPTTTDFTTEADRNALARMPKTCERRAKAPVEQRAPSRPPPSIVRRCATSILSVYLQPFICRTLSRKCRHRFWLINTSQIHKIVSSRLQMAKRGCRQRSQQLAHFLARNRHFDRPNSQLLACTSRARRPRARTDRWRARSRRVAHSNARHRGNKRDQTRRSDASNCSRQRATVSEALM